MGTATTFAAAFALLGLLAAWGAQATERHPAYMNQNEEEALAQLREALAQLREEREQLQEKCEQLRGQLKEFDGDRNVERGHNFERDRNFLEARTERSVNDLFELWGRECRIKEDLWLKEGLWLKQGSWLHEYQEYQDKFIWPGLHSGQPIWKGESPEAEDVKAEYVKAEYVKARNSAFCQLEREREKRESEYGELKRELQERQKQERLRVQRERDRDRERHLQAWQKNSKSDITAAAAIGLSVLLLGSFAIITFRQLLQRQRESHRRKLS